MYQKREYSMSEECVHIIIDTWTCHAQQIQVTIVIVTEGKTTGKKIRENPPFKSLKKHFPKFFGGKVFLFFVANLILF